MFNKRKHGLVVENLIVIKYKFFLLEISWFVVCFFQ